MLQTYPVRQPSQGERGADEVAEPPGAVIGGGIVVNVIMNMICFALILIFDQHELSVCRGRIAEVGENGP